MKTCPDCNGYYCLPCKLAAEEEKKKDEKIRELVKELESRAKNEDERRGMSER